MSAASERVDRGGRVRVGGDDEGVLAAELEVEVLHHRGRDAGDALAGLDRTGERDDPHARVSHEGLTRLAVAGDDGDHPGGEMIEARSHPLEGGKGRQLAGLDDDGVARRQRGCQLPRQQEQRIVPGHDRAHHPVRLLDHQVELGARLRARQHASAPVAGQLRVVAQGVGRPLDLFLLLGPGFALLTRQEGDQLVAARERARRRFVQELGPVVGADPPPRRERAGGIPNGPVDVVGVAGGHVPDHLFGRGVVDRDAAPAHPVTTAQAGRPR